ncbi:hypothetical protein HYX15_00090 [Candidatus Woesearchaeota archaeon]|nr:hypothetical protein [Candidatus Woesearchaeota archaeon]
MNNQEFFGKNLEDISRSIDEERRLNKERQNEELAEIARAEEELARRKKEEEDNKRNSYLQGLKDDEKRQHNFQIYINLLSNYGGNDLERAIFAFVNHPDFSLIFNQTGTIKDIENKWGFITRRAYEIGNEIGISIGWTFQHKDIEIKKALEDYGLYLLCPYFSQDKGGLTGEKCSIDGELMEASCRGRYYTCVIFKEKSDNFELPIIQRQPPKKHVPKIDVKPIDILDLDDWWKMEGKYE